MILTVDIETTFQTKIGQGHDPTPYHPENYMVSVGMKALGAQTNYMCFNHNERPSHPHGKGMVRELLDKTTLFVAHNVKFDLTWLLECGFHYYGEVWDTMLAQYVMDRGTKQPLDLSSCCRRYKLPVKDDEYVKFYLDKGIGFEAMPWDIVEKYGRQDVGITEKLFLAQAKEVGYVI